VLYPLPLVPGFGRQHIVRSVTIGADDRGIRFRAGVAGQMRVLVAAFAGEGGAKLVATQVWLLYRGMRVLVMLCVVAGGTR
jgi:hypothetical protein